MKGHYYLIYPTNANAKSRSEGVMAEIRHNKGARDVTSSWFDTIVHPANKPQSALVVPESELHHLTEKERQQLRDYAFMEKGGWFPENPFMNAKP